MGEPRAVGDLVHVEKFFARNLGGLTRARTRAGPAREGRSRTPSMYADEKSDEVVVPRKRSNKGRQLPAEVVEGRASPEGNSRQAAVVRTLSRATTSIRLAAVRWRACGFKPHAADVRPEGGARCVSSARRDLCGGRSVMSVPTATGPLPDVDQAIVQVDVLPNEPAQFTGPQAAEQRHQDQRPPAPRDARHDGAGLVQGRDVHPDLKLALG